MCDVEAVFGLPDGVEHWVTIAMPELSPSVRPTRFGRDEKPKKSEFWSLTDRQRFEEFRAENNSGYFLYGKGHEYHVQPHDNPPTVFFSCRAEKLAIAFANEILDSLANHGAVCGRGTSREEYQARNGYVMHFVDGGQVSGLLGRDFRRYVPGLYWLNYVSDQYRRTMPVP